ncbi:MAG TPA: bifunctional DNA-formamidopyrimidine glycosylase/DNA-(apurinic or apyrimidinic site) lyase [Candidatus Acidoferrales bacterium]|nr:bifunctional DNA-formamidopyrimidine glycosylase/DNA-(apurinic or apyrimidinic site) lyase [Candidatus Acidoferrales bacterium]
MPELPEVETIVRDLAPRVSGRTIARVRHDRKPPVFDRHSLSPKLAVGKTIERVWRAGKFLVFDLGEDVHLTVHLRMTGNLLFQRDRRPVERQRAVIEFSDGASLVFADVRKFGRMRVLRGDPVATLGLGIDPLAPELDEAAFAAIARGRTTKVKIFLLDQRRLAGVGNIYACEALFEAGIRPGKPVGKLTKAQRERLLRALRRILRKAIQHRGSSVDDYLDAEGKEGEFQKQLRVYGRAGLPCRRCGTPIRRVVLGQRGTFYCPVCQR